MPAMKTVIAIMVLMGTALASLAHADALDAYRHGDYRQAIVLGQSEATAPALVLVARSYLALVDTSQSRNQKADIKAALTAARAATELDDDNIEAHLLQVAALGFLGRGMGKFKSFRKGLASKSHKQIKQALSLAPGSAWPYAMLGMWHLEIIRRGGAFGARMTGANTKDGAEACAYAVDAAPHDGALAALCGLALLAIGKQNLEAQARACLTRARDTGLAQTAYDMVLQSRAGEILSLWDQHGLDSARRRAVFYESDIGHNRKSARG